MRNIYSISTIQKKVMTDLLHKRMKKMKRMKRMKKMKKLNPF